MAFHRGHGLRPFLVLGAGGLLGAAIAQRLGARAVALARADLDIADVARFREALALHRPLAVINAAGLSHGGEDELMEHNARRPARLAEACVEAGCGFVFLSSSRVFGDASPGARSECDPPSPAEAYGASKLAGEEAVRAVLGDTGAWVARISMALGHRAARGESQIVNRLLEAARSGAREVLAASDVRHSPVHARDAAALVERMLLDHPPGTYHITGATPVTLEHLVRRVFASAGLNCAVQGVESARFGGPALPDLTLTTRLLPPAGPWEEAADRLAEDYREAWGGGK
ncbi:dTDP-4-dehydrorhamnose reductase [Fundidesulfovibrio magnetotacticus]|uniref:dTDP-4-dehydrorhamnose reductase n=1 Tax=Fundidesulfovibrio magnetotacticus TaxID=2730080 RepID=A0A6V8LY35_9BACT|nr:sugar nucleotide-binding protein [Fundidesulfovibrio magnetotacticus]GFK94959.1 dTDP-4-dehydrorhamnose reductase [Fundidesulfovibrio magnetotacticus]